MRRIFTIRRGQWLTAALWLLFVAPTLAMASVAPSLNLGALPLWFEAGFEAGLEASTGPAQAGFTAHGRDSEIVIAPDAVQFAFRRAGGQMALARMNFVGANPDAVTSGGAEMAGHVNYLIGNDASHWRTDVPMYGQVRVTNLYPGVDVVYYGNQEQLEYDFNLAANVRPETVVLHFTGAETVSVSDRGELSVQLAGGQVIEHQPIAYQMAGGIRHEVWAGYKILDAHTVTFAVDAYDHALPLVIDPVLSYSTYFGGNNGTIAWAVAVSTNDGSVYIAGQTISTQISNNVPLSTVGAYQTNYHGGISGGDVIVAKFSNQVTNGNPIYCTYLGGTADDVALGLAVDGAGNAFITGFTDSTNFPVTNAIIGGVNNYSGASIAGNVDPNLGVYSYDAFVTEINPGGSNLIYSTYLGGTKTEYAYGIALDTNDDAFIVGLTYSTNFPVTANALQNHPAMVYSAYVTANAFIAEIAPGGRALEYSSYLGGTNFDAGTAIAYNNGYLAIAGYTCSTNFPVTNYIYQPYLQAPYYTTNVVGTNQMVITNFYNGSLVNNTAISNNSLFTPDFDAFAAEYKVIGTNLSPEYVTLLGGSNNDLAYGVALDSAGNAYVVGGTSSTNYLTTSISNTLNMNSFEATNANYALVTNCFLTKISYATNLWNGTNFTATVDYSQVFGGPGLDLAYGVTLDAADNVFVTGWTDTTNIPTTYTNLIGSLASTNAGFTDMFITVFKSDFSTLLFSAYLGGENNDYGHGVAVDSGDNIYLAGTTGSSYFPVFDGREPSYINILNGLLVKIILTNSLPALSLHSSGTNMLISWSPIPYQQAPNNVQLEMNTNLLSTNWIPLVQTPVFTNNSYIYTVGHTNQTSFFQFIPN